MLRNTIFVMLVVLAAAAVFAGPSLENPWQLDTTDEKLVERLQSEKLQTRFDAAVALGERDCLPAVKKLCKMLQEDGDYQGRIGAAPALYGMECTEALPILKKAAAADPNVIVRNTCVGIVRRLDTLVQL